MDAPLDILITNLRLSQRNGTEIVTRDLALGLLRLGHRPVILTQTDGPLATELRAASIPVATDIAQVGGAIDVIHAHHTHMAAIAVARFPHAPCVFVAHDFVAWSDAPPLLPSVRRYVAVDETVADKLVFEHGLSPDRVLVHLNAVDLNRFQPGPELPRKPQRALAFAKNERHLPAIREACAARGIALDVVGQAVGRLIAAPEIWLPRYDLVFASALTALEAMACGRAVIVCDGRGLAGLATAERYAEWRRRNFGLRTLAAPITTQAVLREIDAYDAAGAAEVGRRVRDEAGLGPWLAALLDLYRETMAEHRAAPPSESGTALAMARHLQTWAPRVDARWPWIAERERLIAQRDAVAALARSPGAPNGQLDQLLARAGEVFIPLDELFQRWHDLSLAGRIDQALEQARRYFGAVPAAYVEENLARLRDQLWQLFNAKEIELTSRLCRVLLDVHNALSDGSLYYLAAVSTHLSPVRNGGDNAFVVRHYTLALEAGLEPSWPLYHRGRLRLEQGDAGGRADLERARDLGGDAGGEAARFLASLP
jgi:hypothetical protein